MGLSQGAAVAAPGGPAAHGATRGNAADDPYTRAFLTRSGKIKEAAGGCFSPECLPYHSVETLMVEAPDHGHETTSEAVSFWMWLEAAYGRVTATTPRSVPPTSPTRWWPPTPRSRAPSAVWKSASPRAPACWPRAPRRASSSCA
ncbi:MULTISPECIES: glycoside hydrolase family 48 protein [unclassified Streptomyces]|uniref:glycoside hydrolase family 48 protein n=1 Tax=unclassified Streptomyces TaxID=2593676 RepID=UPI0035DC4844